ncbi:MAG: DUF4350 domain-containing protein [Candidatus Sedimenticola sp. (ex Thyasira tokunagai)]
MRGKISIALAALLAVALAGGITWWFFNNFERATRESRSAVSPQARKNPLLAADYFLSRSGIESRSVSGRQRLLKMPKEPGLLLISHLGPSLPPERESELLNWIEDGGHLVITPEQERDEESESSGNHLLDELGVELLIIDSDELEDAVGSVAVDEKNRDDPTNEKVKLTAIDYPGVALPVNIAFQPQRILLDSKEQAEWGGWDEQGYHLLQYAIGRGRVTVLSDNRFLTNNQIEKGDHALLLWLLARDHERAWLLYSSNMPSLLRLLWSSAPQLMVTALILLWLVVWHLGLTSGPRLADSTFLRRNLLEHLQAAASFSWRVDRAQKMFESSRRAVEQEWQRRHPILARLDRRERCEWIGEQTGLSARAVESALYGDYSVEQEFIRISSVLQKLAMKR